MRRQTNLRVLMNYFALSLHPHTCVLLAPCRESVNVCVYYVRVRIAVLLQICAITRFTAEVGAKMEHPLFVMHATAATICVQILRATVYQVSIQTLYYFLGGLSRNRHFRSTASERQSVTSWVATRCLALKAFCKDFFLFIVNNFWWTRRGANKHSKTDKVKVW